MKINPKILEIIEKADKNEDDILLYLLSLYHKLSPSYIPDYVKKSTNILGIVNRDFKGGTVQWLVPLFDSNTQEIVESDSNWDWVWIEYRNLWKEIDPKKVGDKQGCLKKMKKFFSEHPLVRKDDVIKAANAYLLNFHSGKNDPKFLIQADYFIKKAEISRLAQYVELVEDEKQVTTKTNKMMRGVIRRRDD